MPACWSYPPAPCPSQVESSWPLTQPSQPWVTSFQHCFIYKPAFSTELGIPTCVVAPGLSTRTALDEVLAKWAGETVAESGNPVHSLGLHGTSSVLVHSIAERWIGWRGQSPWSPRSLKSRGEQLTFTVRHWGSQGLLGGTSHWHYTQGIGLLGVEAGDHTSQSSPAQFWFTPVSPEIISSIPFTLRLPLWLSW